MTRLLILFYILAIVSANLIAYHIGQKGLVITAFILIPFDLVIRAFFHEKWKGVKLWRNLILLIGSGSLICLVLNFDMKMIAIGSFFGFLLAGLTASIFYQTNIKKRYIYKVNGSDLVAIITDSFVFQFIAFNDISFLVMLGQILMKFTGGLLWYWIIFEKLKLQNKWI